MTRPGDRLAHYEIVSHLGKGGMGEVWRAHDSKLERDVALKTLPPELTEDADRLARLEREAKALAAVTHPNIAAIHGFEEDSGIRFLVLELVDGETLEERLRRGAIPVEETLGLALQIAEAVEAAHERGIIHRDLKPANIKITKTNQVKVLDFGIAKTIAAGGDVHSPTLTLATVKGAVIGTPAYMSPEQVRGEDVDSRTDIWAFGVILTEMLTGKALFRSASEPETMARVLEAKPVLSDLPANTPRRIARLIARCLEKNPHERLRHIGDARLEIGDVLSGSDPLPDVATTAKPARRTGPLLPIAGLAAFVLIGAGAWLGGILLEPAPVPRHAQIAVLRPLLPPTQGLAISPDGQTVAYAAIEQVVTWSVATGQSQFFGEGSRPFFSPGGETLGIFTGTGTRLELTPVGGGLRKILVDRPERQLGGSWGDDDRIVVATNVGLFRVDAAGGEPELLITPDLELGELSFAWPDVLPGAGEALFTIIPAEIDAPMSIGLIDLETHERQDLLTGGNHARYLATGHIAFARDGALMAVAFDRDRRRVLGEPFSVGVELASIDPRFAASKDGTLVHVPPLAPAMTEASWVDPNDGSEETVPALAGALYVRLSRDATRVVFDSSFLDGNRELYVYDFGTGVRTRLTDHPREDLLGDFDPSGEIVYFSSNRDVDFDLFSAPSDASAQPAKVVDTDSQTLLSAVSTDGSLLLLYGGGYVDLAGGETIPTPLSTRPVEDRVSSAELSANGSWLAYQSDESGRTEAFIRPFPGLGGPRIQVSNNGGQNPMWSPDGSKIYYQNLPGDMISVEILDWDPMPTLGQRRIAFPNRGYIGAVEGVEAPTRGRAHDISNVDGRFLMSKTPDQETVEVEVVFNWFEALAEYAR